MLKRIRVLEVMLDREKKGQITVFIIIGIVAVILVILLAYFLIRESGVKDIKEITKAQRQLDPVESFITDCIEQTAKKALDILGSQGGWIDLNNPALTGQSFTFTENPTESDGLQLTQGGAKIPYWYYLKSRNQCGDCQFSAKIPGLDLIASQISWYIENNIGECTGNFESFSEQNIDVRELGDLKANTLITEEDVVVVINYPIETTINSRETRTDEHYVNLGINFRKLYSFANEIAESQKENNFLEYSSMNIVGAYSSLDPNKLPPVADATPGPGKVVWSRFNSENLMKNLLVQTVGLLTVPGTNNFNPIGSEDIEEFSLRQGATYSYVFQLLDEDSDYEDYGVSFAYMNWPIYFDITPRDGDLIRPQEISGIFQDILQFFTQNYRFYYDISYPVMVEIRDTQAYNKRGYSFLFALESNVRNNKPLLPGPQFYLTSIGAPSATLFSSPESRISGNILIKARDDKGGNVESANVNYNCASESVYLGLTNNRGVFSSRFPVCYGGLLQISKAGHLSFSYPLNTQVGAEQEIDANLSKFTNKKATMKIITENLIDELENIPVGSSDVIAQRDAILARASEVGVADSIMYTITKVSDSEFEEPNSKFMFFDSENIEQEINLVPGQYEINANYYDANGFTIPAEEIEIAGEDVELEEIEFKPAPLGGAYLGNETGHYFIVNNEDLESDKNLELYVLKFDPPVTHTEMASLGELKERSGEHYSLIMPKWK